MFRLALLQTKGLTAPSWPCSVSASLSRTTAPSAAEPGRWRWRSPRRAWRKLHVGVDAGTGRIVASTLTTNDVNDASHVGPLLDQVADPIGSFTADDAYDQGSPTLRPPHGIPMLSRSSHPAPVLCRALRPRRCQPSVNSTSGPSPSADAWAGRGIGKLMGCGRNNRAGAV
ncbi:transposase [Roseomonas chloroacetimidivorans]|uniref:transposase n=1 Tax=Roseomonas chloroacetimidivorans TaxID=1766656 RepID=UPI003C736295